MCAALQGCAGETQERPPRGADAARSAPTIAGDAPRSEAAFQDPPRTRDDGAHEARAPERRFGVRRIGEERAPPARFRGAPVDLDLEGADVHDVFRLLADVGEVGVVVAAEVRETVTMRLRGMPWDQAMDVLASAAGLTCVREGDVILVRAAGTNPSGRSPRR